ncbi:MAG: helix-turn-helix transcriptional regulator [Gammaproteobacteria bacterium]|nr:helix-turn-helix transcriptional regulator [Gammaproteobacteria bacterium]MBI5618717.1 helix-turn-helix transcriptional regulator [Gammaproteobacteria bacterium]
MKKSAAAHLAQFDPAAMLQQADAAAALMRTLANSHRLMIMCILAQGELCVGDLNARLPLSQSALSQHLAVMREAGLVSWRREAQTIYYGVAPGPALGVIALLHEHFCGLPAKRGARARAPKRRCATT